MHWPNKLYYFLLKMDGRHDPSSNRVCSGGATSPPSSEFEASSPPMMDGRPKPKSRYEGMFLPRRPNLSDKAPEILGSSPRSSPPTEVTTRGGKQGKQGKQGGKQYRQYMRVKFKTSVFVF